MIARRQYLPDSLDKIPLITEIDRDACCMEVHDDVDCFRAFVAPGSLVNQTLDTYKRRNPMTRSST